MSIEILYFETKYDTLKSRTDLISNNNLVW